LKSLRIVLRHCEMSQRVALSRIHLSGSDPQALLDCLVYVVDRCRRNGHNFGHDIIGDVDSAWPLRVGLHVSNVKRGSDEPPIAQGNLGYAVPNGRDLDRRLLRSDLE
jgi:hypothetical protein